MFFQPADHLIEFRPPAAGNARAYNHVGLPAVSEQKNGESA